MRSLTPLTVGLLLLMSSVRAQDSRDSSMIALARSAFALSTQRPDSALTLSNRVLQQYQLSGNGILGGFAYKARGWAFFHAGKYDSAFSALEHAAALFRNARDTVELMYVYLNLARAHSNNSEFGKSTSYVLMADSLADRTDDGKAKASVKSQMAILLREQKQYSRAVEYFKEAIEGYSDIKDTVYYLGAVGSLSILYNTISRPDSSLIWLNKCLPLLKALKGYEYEHAMVYERLADTYLALHRYPEALDDYRQAFDIFRLTGNKADQAFEAMNLGRTLTDMGRSKEAEGFLLESYHLNDSLHLTNYSVDAASALSDLYSSRRDWQKAYQWQSATRRLEDTMHLVEQNEKTVELQSKYEAEKKDKEIILLKKDQEVHRVELQKQKTIKITAFILSGFLILTGFLVANRYRLIQKNQRLMEIEKLRNNIARDLHDDIGSVLSSIHINSNMALSHPEQEGVVKTQLEKIQKHSGRMMESMGDIVWAINPVNDSMDNLLTKMKEFLAEILEPLNICYRFTGIESLKKIKVDIGKRKEIYLVFKEAVNNAAKYSGCTELEVSIRDGGRELVLEVIDNGQGFDNHTIRHGNGLRNMQQRALALGGTLAIAAAPGKGTRIALRIPIV